MLNPDKLYQPTPQEWEDCKFGPPPALAQMVMEEASHEELQKLLEDTVNKSSTYMGACLMALSSVVGDHEAVKLYNDCLKIVLGMLSGKEGN